MKKIKDSYLLKFAFLFVIIITIGVIKTKINYSENSGKLELITYLNDNQAYHPKVISFENKWNGYKYWMAFTPYKEKDAMIENPCINVSNDMINWSVPNGLSNPLDKPSIENKKYYDSDTHLLYNKDTDSLELFWRYVDEVNNKSIIYRMISKDGINWDDKEEFLVSENRKSIDYVSPVINYDNGIYQVWFVNKKAVYYIEISEDETTSPKKMNIKYDSTLYTWHIDIIKNGDYYEMVMVAYQNVSNRKQMHLYYSKSSDNENWTTPVEILSPTKVNSNWDGQGLYRSSILYENGKYYIFYSGHDTKYNVGVGLVCGTDINKLENCVD